MLRSALSLALLLCCLPAATAAPAESRFTPCTDTANFPELAGSQCLTTTLPLRHAAPGDGSISVFVRRFPVAVPAQRRGEVWLVAGGPGEAGAAFHTLLATLRRAFPQYELVIADHRGTGGSERLCPLQESPGSADGVALAGDEWGPCIGALHADQARTTAFSITEAAHDLSTLIARQRGDGEVLLYGVSYGTQLALRMLQVAPQPLDGLILDGLVPPETATQWDLSHRTAVVDAVGRAALGEADTAAYQRLLASTGLDPAWRAQMPGGDLRRFFGTLLNFPLLRDRIPAIVEALGRDDDTLLRATVAELRATTAPMTRHPLSPPALPLVMLIAASENNARPDLDRATVEAESRDALFTSAIPGLLVDPPVPRYPRDAWFGGTPSTLPRTLVIHGTLDPNTPYAGAQAHAARLAAAGPVQLSTVDGGAHLLSFVAPECFVAAVATFAAGGTAAAHCTEPAPQR